MEFRLRRQASVELGASDGVVLAASFMLLAAALVHLALAPEHFAQWWAFGVLFGVAAALQALLAIVFVRRPTRRGSAWICALTLGILGVWLLSRTSGLPLGPDAGEPESADWLDLLTCLDELLLTMLLAIESGWTPGRLATRLQPLCRIGGTAVALLLTLVFAGGVAHG